MVGFQLVTGQEMFIGDYVKFIVYISSSLSQLYILCWNGDDLIQHVSRLLDIFILSFKMFFLLISFLILIFINNKSLLKPPSICMAVIGRAQL